MSSSWIRQKRVYISSSRWEENNTLHNTRVAEKKPGKEKHTIWVTRNINTKHVFSIISNLKLSPERREQKNPKKPQKRTESFQYSYRDGHDVCVRSMWKPAAH